MNKWKQMNVAADTIQQTMLTKVRAPLAVRGTCDLRLHSCNSCFMRVIYRRVKADVAHVTYIFLHYSTLSILIFAQSDSYAFELVD